MDTEVWRTHESKDKTLVNSQSSDEFSNFELLMPLRFSIMNFIDFSRLIFKQFLLFLYQVSNFKLIGLLIIVDWIILSIVKA